MAAEDLHIGVAGSSARYHAERLRHDRELRPREGARLERAETALFPPPEARRRRLEERNWLTGAEGEHGLAAFLARRCPDVPMLHDRAAPLSRANIDHIAIAPSGVYVIDCKRYRGKIEVTTPLFGAQKLKVNGRNRTSLVRGLERQVAHVQAALAGLTTEIPVHGCLCFVAPEGRSAGVGLPILRTPRIDGYPLYYAKRLAKRLNRPGPIGSEEARALQGELAQRLPPALRVLATA
ncbi:MAG TPA: nuclease-related domain-containing protein [Solirubrobacteraceae bacterium]|nr:nuclease-related domain-containing protein [Solirubrobacteraceae bacterium]